MRATAAIGTTFDPGHRQGKVQIESRTGHASSATLHSRCLKASTLRERMDRSYPGIGHLVISRLIWMQAVRQISGVKNSSAYQGSETLSLGRDDVRNSTVVVHLDGFETGVIRPQDQARDDHLRVGPSCLDSCEQTFQRSLHLRRCPALDASLVPMCRRIRSGRSACVRGIPPSSQCPPLLVSSSGADETNPVSSPSI